MDHENRCATLRLRTVLSHCDRALLGTSLQMIRGDHLSLSLQNFQLQLTLHEETEENTVTNKQGDREGTVDSNTSDLVPTKETTVAGLFQDSDPDSDLTSEQTVMASQFEEVLAMRKMVQVESLGVEEDEAVIEARTRTFVRWINGCLHSQGIHIKNLDSDLESGVVLIKLLETLAHGKRIPGRLVILQFKSLSLSLSLIVFLMFIYTLPLNFHYRYYGHPVIRIQKVQNLMVAFRFLTEVEKIPLMNISKSSNEFFSVS